MNTLQWISAQHVADTQCGTLLSFERCKGGYFSTEKDHAFKIIGKTKTGIFLPSDYQEVEYIQSTGTQYINTGFVPQNNYKYRFTFIAPPNQGYNNGYFGANASKLAEGSNNRFMWYYSTVNAIYFAKPPENEEHTIYVSNSTIFVDDRAVATFPAPTATEARQLLIFSMWYGGQSNTRTSYKYKRLIVYNNEDVVIKDYVPCYRKSDGVIGVYDVIGNQFFTNSGTGVFLKGNDTSNRPTLYNPVKINAVKAGTQIVCGDSSSYENTIITPADLYDGDIWYPTLGKIERHNAVVTLNGVGSLKLRSWSADVEPNETGNCVFYWGSSDGNHQLENQYCTHFVFEKEESIWSANSNYFGLNNGQSSSYSFSFPPSSHITNVNEANAWLAEQAESNTPVSVVYKLKTVIEESVPPVNIPTKKGGLTIGSVVPIDGEKPDIMATVLVSIH